jgi:hypothetical protein
MVREDAMRADQLLAERVILRARRGIGWRAARDGRSPAVIQARSDECTARTPRRAVQSGSCGAAGLGCGISRRAFCAGMAGLLAGTLGLRSVMAAPSQPTSRRAPSLAPAPGRSIQAENQLPGTTRWQVPRLTNQPTWNVDERIGAPIRATAVPAPWGDSPLPRPRQGERGWPDRAAPRGPGGRRGRADWLAAHPHQSLGERAAGGRGRPAGAPATRHDQRSRHLRIRRPSGNLTVKAAIGERRVGHRSRD